MSFDTGLSGPSESIHSAKDCRPDYEGQAAMLKKKVDAAIRLEEALVEYAEECSMHRFSNVQSYAEFLGGVIIIRNEHMRAYEQTLKLVEK